MRKFIFLTFILLSSIAALSQSGSVTATAIKSRVADSTTVTTPTGYGTLIYNAQASPAKWEIWENGIKYDLKKFSSGGSVTSIGLLPGTSGTDVNISGSPITSSGNITINIPTASGTNRGVLSTTDWTTFNGKENVLSFTSPLSRSTNTISIPAANGSTNGYLSSTDWTTFNNKQSAFSILGLNKGGTGSDLSATGGTGQFLKQTTSGGNVSVGQISLSDLPSISATSVLGTSSGAGTPNNIGPATAYQILRANSSGTTLQFGSIDLSQTAAVGSSILPIANGGTNQSSLITAPTASAIVAQDANKNYSANNLAENYTSTATSGGTTTLTVSSSGLQYFTGSSNQTVVLPVVSTLPQTGFNFVIVNLSSGTLTVNSSGGNLVQTMASNTQATITAILLTGTTAASWNVLYGYTNLSSTDSRYFQISNNLSEGNASTMRTNLGLGTIATKSQTSGTSIQKGDGSGGFSSAVANTDYLAVNNPAYTGSITTGTLGYSDTGILGAVQSSTNSYNQFIIQNTSTGTTASSDFVVNNNNSTATTFYGDFGMNGGGFTGSGSLNAANNVYLTSTSTDLVIGTTTNNSLRFVTNGSTTDNLIISGAGQLTLNSNTTGNNLTGTFTASANNQNFLSINPSVTSRSTSGDFFDVESNTSSITANSTNIVGSALKLSPTYKTSSGIISTNNGSAQYVSKTVAGMTVNTYTNVAPASTSGSGTGALFTVVVATATTFTSVTVTTAGSNYNYGETITFNGSQFGSGSGSIVLKITGTTNSFARNNGSPLTIQNNIPQDAGSNVTLGYIDFTNSTGTSVGGIYYTIPAGQGIGNPTLNFADRSGSAFTLDGTTFTLARALSMGSNTFSSGAMTSSGLITGINFLANGSSLSSAYNFTGTLSSGSAAFINNASPTSPTTSASFTGSFQSGGSSRTRATAATTIYGFRNNTIPLPGNPTGFTISAGGSGYVNGTYNGVTFSILSSTSGALSAATGNVTVSGGAVTSVSPNFLGTNFAVNDQLTVTAAQLGGSGSGFVYQIIQVDGGGAVNIGYVNNPSIVDPTSAGSYISFQASPTYNITSTQAGFAIGYDYNPTVTAIGSYTHYGLRIAPTGTLNGIGISSPLSTWDVNGSFGPAISTSTGSLTLDATYHTVVITSGTGSYTFPSASGATRRIYVVVNQTGSARTVSSYKDKSGASQTTVGANAVLWVQSDGSNWYQIN
jgi:hypothetical protein